MRRIASRGSGPGPEDAQRTAWRILITSSISVVLVFLNSSALVIALPDMSRDLRASGSEASWVLLSYMLSTTTLILVFGRSADLVGRRRLYIAGIAVFLLASLACGLAPTAPLLIAARVLQGVGAASIITNTTALLTDAFPERTLSLGLGLNATAAAVGQVIGPLVGGVVSESLGWRWIFLAGIPVSLVSLVWSLRLIPRRPRPRTRERLDVVGSLLSIGAIGAIVAAVSLGGTYGWGSPQLAAVAGVALLLSAMFAWSQRRVAHPLVDPAIFRDRATITLYSSALLCAISSYALILLASLSLQALDGLSALDAAVRILPAPVGTTVAAIASGLLARRFGARPLATIGMLLIAIGAVALSSSLTGRGGDGVSAAALGAVGAGIGIFMTPSTSALMVRIPEHRRGIANAIRATLQNAGYLLSTAVALAIATSGLTVAQQTAAYDGSLLDLSAADVRAFAEGIRAAALTFAGLGVLGVLVTAFGPRGDALRPPPHPLENGSP
ncbi:MFS transporter [Clavibacter sp. VKM Ac-2542]|uniref:MFS transporter n=1 Tax=Clavibacter sp. VKM Ac-2542 TaxID=2783811 RepID=UPI00188CF7CD|nr:MFS transporter [Clavibacter sp. VKM Ac-2542]MBF4621163.1 MFS transporter [Clavibacter sp. VKM Ac-2542]